MNMNVVIVQERKVCTRQAVRHGTVAGDAEEGQRGRFIQVLSVLTAPLACSLHLDHSQSLAFVARLSLILLHASHSFCCTPLTHFVARLSLILFFATHPPTDVCIVSL